MSPSFRAGLLLLLPTLVGASAAAQTDVAAEASQSSAPAHIAIVDGDAWLDRQGQSDRAPVNMPLIAGDRLRTERGRAEVIFGDGSVLDLDQFTTVDFQSPSLLRLLAGRVRLMIAGLDPDDPDERVDYRVDAPSGHARLLTVGDYRLALVGAPAAVDLETAVLRGSAEVATDLGSVALSPGERAFARAGSPPSYPTSFNSARWDAFDRWSEAQRDARLGTSSSTAAYLPAPVRSYAATFDHHGYWDHHPSYGYIWYPAVSVGWRPYSYGHWSFVGAFGWTWIGYDPWAWPTHHYGRWGFSADAWFWIPGIAWGPAWVSWAWSPGYVGWCPLGYGGRPVVSINTFVTNYYPRGPHRPWHGWTVARSEAFAGGHVAVPRHEIPLERLTTSTRSAFVRRTEAPTPQGLAASRLAVPIRSVGDRSRVAVPRNPGGPRALSQDVPRSVGGGAVNRSLSTAPSAGRRTMTQAPAAGGLGAPPRIGGTGSSPGLGALPRRPSPPPAGTVPRADARVAQPRRETGSPVAPSLPSGLDRGATRVYGPVYGAPGGSRAIRRSPGAAGVSGDRSGPAGRSRPTPQLESPRPLYSAPVRSEPRPLSPRGDAPAAIRRGSAPPPPSAPPSGIRPAPGSMPSAPRAGGPGRGPAPVRPPSAGVRPGPRGTTGRAPGASRGGGASGGSGGTAARRRPG